MEPSSSPQSLRISFASIHDPGDVTAWSGTEHFLLHTLKDRGNHLSVLRNIRKRQRMVGKALRNLSNVLTGGEPYTVERTLFTANGPSGDLSIVDVASGKVERRIALEGSPWGVAVAEIR